MHLFAPMGKAPPILNFFGMMAGTTRLELATSAVTGQRSNQLNYVPAVRNKRLSKKLKKPSHCHV